MSLSILLSVLSIIIVGIGYSIKNVKPNPVFGIRLKWALEDETNWKKTHQFSGILWMICGLFGLFCAYIQSMALFIVIILVLCLAPVIYSYGFYRKQLKEHRTTKVKYPFYLILFMIGISLFVVYSLFCGKLTYQFYTDKLVIGTNNWKNYEIEYDQIESISLDADMYKSVRTNGFGNLKCSMGTFENDSLGSYQRYSYSSCKSIISIKLKDTYVLINDTDKKKTELLYKKIVSKT